MADADYEILNSAAFFIFLTALVITIYYRQRARMLDTITGKKIRSIYRHAWVEAILKRNEPMLFTDTIRNNILISTALLSAVILSFGFVLNAGAVTPDGNPFHAISIVSILALLGYSLFMLLLEIRTLTYVPIISQTPETMIRKYEGVSKASRISKLLHESFDHFSNAMRALFYIAPLLIWFYNTYLFIAVTLVLSYLMHRDDFGTKSGITIF